MGCISTMSELSHNNVIRDNSFAAIALATIVLGYVIFSRNARKGEPISNLPGPERAFLLGNVKNFPTKAWSDTFKRWREQMGTFSSRKLPLWIHKFSPKLP
jgi:hypothetical protein